MKNYNAKTVSEYIAGVPEDKRAALRKMRQLILEAVPGVEEKIAWGMPAFKYKGKYVAGFAAFKNHCSFFPYSSTKKLGIGKALAKYESTEGAIHFTSEKMLPAPLVKKIVKAKAKMIEDGKARM